MSRWARRDALRRARPTLRLVTLLCCCCVAGCDDASGSTLPPDAASADVDAESTPAACDPSTFSAGGTRTAVSFVEDVLPFFRARCAFGGCHLGLDQPGQMRLGETCVFDVATSTCRVPDGGATPEVAATIHANLLDFAIVAPAMHRVDPGRPDRSFILYKLSGCQQSDPDLTGCTECGNPMPPGAPLLHGEPDKFELLSRWIAQGAPLN